MGAHSGESSFLMRIGSLVSGRLTNVIGSGGGLFCPTQFWGGCGSPSQGRSGGRAGLDLGRLIGIN
jgi:hypothetical protein